MPPLTEPIVFSPTKHAHHVPAICEIHRECVKVDHTVASIIDVDHPTKLKDFWTGFSQEVGEGTRAIVIQFAQTPRGIDEVVGVATLLMPASETGPHRCWVEKLLVSPRFRRQGLARRLMGKLEMIAREKGRWLMLLDTVIGSGAEHFYPKLGYVEVGTIPNYGVSPVGGMLVDEMFFYKDLRAAPR
ncbi:unnamed protein product [Zymoseptoria tritici ST99CH_3D1]|nr:unnamed protein product [Zymoseptoria tritici ST99CH_3D1]